MSVENNINEALTGDPIKLTFKVLKWIFVNIGYFLAPYYYLYKLRNITGAIYLKDTNNEKIKTQHLNFQLYFIISLIVSILFYIIYFGKLLESIHLPTILAIIQLVIAFIVGFMFKTYYAQFQNQLKSMEDNYVENE